MYLRDPSKYRYLTNNIIIGRAELQAIQLRGGQPAWALPGGGAISNKEKAVKYAQRMNDLMHENTLRICASKMRM